MSVETNAITRAVFQSGCLEVNSVSLSPHFPLFSQPPFYQMCLLLILPSAVPLKGTRILGGLVSMRLCVCFPAYVCPLTTHWSVFNTKWEFDSQQASVSFISGLFLYIYL